MPWCAWLLIGALEILRVRLRSRCIALKPLGFIFLGRCCSTYYYAVKIM